MDLNMRARRDGAEKTQPYHSTEDDMRNSDSVDPSKYQKTNNK